MVRTWLASGLVALLCVACDVPLYGLGDPPPEASVDQDADAADASVPVMHVDASIDGAPDAREPIRAEAGAVDAHGMEAGAPDSAMQQDAGDEPQDDGGDPKRGGELRFDAHRDAPCAFCAE